uniref:Uncharacterized protein n=1 Tax=Moniliophthora roreri TaxID=221103 RepID=A0A0W0FNH5_MONRR
MSVQFANSASFLLTTTIVRLFQLSPIVAPLSSAFISFYGPSHPSITHSVDAPVRMSNMATTYCQSQEVDQYMQAELSHGTYG